MLIWLPFEAVVSGQWSVLCRGNGRGGLTVGVQSAVMAGEDLISHCKKQLDSTVMVDTEVSQWLVCCVRLIYQPRRCKVLVNS
jgi:hypothetical protein